MRDVTEIIKEKTKAKLNDGWTTFEQFSDLERAIEGDEKLADLISKWERFSRNHAQYKKERVKFVFKRKLFVNHTVPSPVELEESLMKYQAMDCVKRDLVPLE